MTDLPIELMKALRQVYEPAGLTLTDAPQREAQSAEYGACRLGLDGRTVVFRVAKITPRKIGQFVTLWKRPAPTAQIVPLDAEDGVAVVVVSVSDATHCGQFVFSQQTLVAHKVMSVSGKGGKRALRVYPPWSKPVAKDALKTQQWQLEHYLALDPPGDAATVRRLFDPALKHALGG